MDECPDLSKTVPVAAASEVKALCRMIKLENLGHSLRM